MKSTGHSAQCGDHTAVVDNQFKYDFADNGARIETPSDREELHPIPWEYSYTRSQERVFLQTFPRAFRPLREPEAKYVHEGIMNHISKVLPKGLALLVLLSALQGCAYKRTPTQERNNQSVKAENRSALGGKEDGIREAVGPGYDRLKVSQQIAFEAVSKKWDLIDDNTLVNLFIVQNAPVIERPEFWVELIERDISSAEFKSYCLRLLFLRHVRPGDSLEKIAGISGTKEWFVEDETFASVVAASYLPIARSSSGMYAFVPNFATNSNVGIVFSTPKDFPTHEIIAVLRGDARPDPDMYVVDLSVY